jgi:hypothetical protein
MLLVLVAACSQRSFNGYHLALVEVTADKFSGILESQTGYEVCLSFACLLIGKPSITSNCEFAACNAAL